MKITLAHRHFGVHKTVKETEVPGDFSDYATTVPDTHGDYVIAEDKLIAALPDGWLPGPARHILLAVDEEWGGTGQRGLTRFRDWAKYFDAYCLNLEKPPADDGTQK